MVPADVSTGEHITAAWLNDVQERIAQRIKLNSEFDRIEHRALATAIRAQGRRLIGYAATFGTPAQIEGRFTETIKAGAFSDTLNKRGDVLALVDHDSSKLLGRTASGTLRLSEDSRGLAFEVDVPPTTLGNDVLAMAERGDLGGMSFGFRTLADHWSNERTRELRSVQLIEVSVVHAFPAYSGTSVQARRKESAGSGHSSAARRRRLVEAL
jgi:HK97 family phage prohead protease